MYILLIVTPALQCTEKQEREWRAGGRVGDSRGNRVVYSGGVARVIKVLPSGGGGVSHPTLTSNHFTVCVWYMFCFCSY